MTNSTDDTPDSGELLADIIPAAAPPPRRRRGRPPNSERFAASASASAGEGAASAVEPPPHRASAEQTTLRLIEEAVPVPPPPARAITAALGRTDGAATAAAEFDPTNRSNIRGSPMHSSRNHATARRPRVSPHFASRPIAISRHMSPSVSHSRRVSRCRR